MLNFFRAFLDISILIGVVIGSLLSLTGLLGAVIPALDLINHFQLVFLVITLVCIAATFVWPFYYPRFKPVGRAILMVPLISSLLLVGPEAFAYLTSPTLDKAEADQSGDKILKVMSFNIYLGNWDRPGTARAILKNDPDIVLLQEYPPNRFKRQADLKKRYPYQVRCHSWRRCTLAILSKYPLKDLKSHVLGPDSTRDALHGRMLSATLNLPGYVPLRLHSLHADWPNPLGHQRSHLESAASIIQRESSLFPNVLLGGDFNATGWAFELDRFVEKAGLERHSYLLPTFPSQNSRIKRLPLPSFLNLDHIMTRGSVEVSDVVRGRVGVGDHRPIYATIALKKQ